MDWGNDHSPGEGAIQNWGMAPCAHWTNSPHTTNLGRFVIGE